MRIRRDEAVTGALVVATAAALFGILLALGAPGLFRSFNTYYVFFDNAGGIRDGTDVLLAGRRVGQVVAVESPVPMAERPPGHEDCEARVELRVREDARIYRAVTPRMAQWGLLGEQMIDFVNGDEASGVAPSDSQFVGERVAGLSEAGDAIVKSIEPVSQQALATLHELERTLVNLNGLTGEGGDLNETAGNIRQFSDTIKRQPWRLVWPNTKKYPEEAKDRGHEPEERRR